MKAPAKIRSGLIMSGILLSTLAVGSLAGSSIPAEDAAQGKLVTIRMIDKSTAEWRFEPENVTVSPGDTVRWMQEDIAPHNVEFKNTPKAAKLGEAMLGPFLLTRGETYELVIDDRFAPGPYAYVCTAHFALGQKGVLTVSD
jgi:plastocyanin